MRACRQGDPARFHIERCNPCRTVTRGRSIFITGAGASARNGGVRQSGFVGSSDVDGAALATGGDSPEE
jgi:hypothetical protein